MATYQAQIGSVSHGTLRNEDLLTAFANECDHLSVAPSLVKEANLLLSNDDCNRDTAHEIINELIDALNEVAPPNCYFGAHDGDGSNFGFWPIELPSKFMDSYLEDN